MQGSRMDLCDEREWDLVSTGGLLSLVSALPALRLPFIRSALSGVRLLCQLTLYTLGAPNFCCHGVFV